MQFLKHYLTKRYFIFAALLFLVWYPGSFLLYITYMMSENDVLGTAMNIYFPLLVFLFSFFYFKKSINDWEDRFLVAFGWIFLLTLVSAILVKPVYGFEWTSIINTVQIVSNWGSFLVVLVAGMIVKGMKK